MTTKTAVRRKAAPVAEIPAPEGNFASRLAARMHAKGWNQSDLARACAKHIPPIKPGQRQAISLDRDMVSRYVRGLSVPGDVRLDILAKALECSREDLMPHGQGSGRGTAFSMRDAGAGRVSLQINRTMSLLTATKIIALLAEEDK